MVTDEFSALETLTSLLDAVRFGMTRAAEHGLYYGHGTDNVWDDMLALMGGSLKLPPHRVTSLLASRLTVDEKTLLTTQLRKRCLDKIPVPYLIQEAYFCGESYYVDGRVLIPRSPLAELIEQQFSPWVEAHAVHRVLDLCTGSGCVAIACAQYFPDATVIASDVSADALAVAQINVTRHHVGDRVTLIQSDVWDNIPPGPYDLIIANPPYVSAAEMQTLPAEYHHEPAMALEAPEEGLAIVHRILSKLGAYLAPHGIAVIEVGNSQAPLVQAYPEAPFLWLEFERGGEGVCLLAADQCSAFRAAPQTKRKTP